MQHSNTESARSQPPERCPSCDNPVTRDNKTFPFCSDRCRLVDLGQWLDEKYKFTRPIEFDDELTD